MGSVMPDRAEVFAHTGRLVAMSAAGYVKGREGDDIGSALVAGFLVEAVHQLDEATARGVLVDALGVLGGLRGEVQVAGVDEAFIRAGLGLSS